jgi:hypothetical protein
MHHIHYLVDYNFIRNSAVTKPNFYIFMFLINFMSHFIKLYNFKLIFYLIKAIIVFKIFIYVDFINHHFHMKYSIIYSFLFLIYNIIKKI